jgi:solute carrier family 10 (sodium/bile acid cotransporter), member 7
MRFKPDPQIVGILAAVALAIVFPISGVWAERFSLLTKVAVALLFFLYGARLPREAVIAGLVRWRLHATVLSINFILFPLISLLWGFIPASVLAAPLIAGLTYFCCLPSTVQSNVALVASGRGDIAAAVCAASASNLLGVIVSPLLVGLLMRAQGAHVSIDAIQGIVVQLLLPFAAGQIAHRWLGAALEKRKGALSWYDRSTIMMIVYSAFSAAIVGRVFSQVTPVQLAIVVAICLVLFLSVFAFAVRLSRALGFPVTDEIVVAICGTQKGMVVGVPMASLIFPAASVGLIVLPLMIYHQIQLIGCAVFASRYAKRDDAARSAA